MWHRMVVGPLGNGRSSHSELIDLLTMAIRDFVGVGHYNLSYFMAEVGVVSRSGYHIRISRPNFNPKVSSHYHIFNRHGISILNMSIVNLVDLDLVTRGFSKSYNYINCFLIYLLRRLFVTTALMNL